MMDEAFKEIRDMISLENHIFQIEVSCKIENMI